MVKVIFALCLFGLPLTAKDLVWTPAVIESSFRKAENGALIPYGQSSLANTSVRESIYIDAGEWLYHVTQTVHLNGALNLRDGTHVEVAVEGKHLYLGFAGKQRKLAIDEKSRGKGK